MIDSGTVSGLIKKCCMLSCMHPFHWGSLAASLYLLVFVIIYTQLCFTFWNGPVLYLQLQPVRLVCII